jgi:hypothetical protein
MSNAVELFRGFETRPLARLSSLARLCEFCSASPPPPPSPAQMASEGKAVYTLVLLRHGESTWNAENRFTGACARPVG